MPTLLRIILALLCLAIAAFCLFGLLATLEPMPAGQQWTWRVIYGGVALLCAVGIVLLSVSVRRGS